MYVTRIFLFHTAFLSRFRHSHRLLLSFILVSFLATSCSEADDPPTPDKLSKITLQRSACFGTCPEYKVTIHGDGRVVFTTEIRQGRTSTVGVVLPGTHEDRIDPGAVGALFEQFRNAGFFHLRSSYRAAITDNPTYVLTVVTEQRYKSVEDYAGKKAGMPAAVTELEHAVDKAAGTDRWVRGSAGLITWLEARNFDFRSSEAVKLAVVGGYGRAEEATILALIDHGAPLDSDVSIYSPQVVRQVKEKFPEYTPPSPGVSLMESAIKRGLARLFHKLAAGGWLDRLGKQKADQLFARSAGGCSPALVDAAADAGIDIDAPALDPMSPIEHLNGQSILFGRYPADEQGKTALANLGSFYVCVNREADRVATAQRLLARGANPNHRDSLGHTPLFEVANRDMVNLLLAHGAEHR
jgi:hypothetical protein